MDFPDCTVVILTYKGKHHLEHLLPTLRAAIAKYSPDKGMPVLIIDNGKDEATKAFVEHQFPEYTFRFSEKNDFLFSMNAFIEKLETEFVFILNDDVRLKDDIFFNLIPLMKQDPSLFAVTCKIRDWDDTYTVSSVRMAKYDKGWLYNYYLDRNESEVKYTLYPSGGGAIFRTKMFNQLKGFDDLYRPGYSEDVDLGIKAWQHGWKTIYNPKAELYHREGGSMKTHFEQDRLTQAIYKNQILCMVKNVKSTGFMFWFWLLMPYRLMVSLSQNKNTRKALLQALAAFPQAYRKRTKAKPVMEDKDWLKMLNTKYYTS